MYNENQVHSFYCLKNKSWLHIYMPEVFYGEYYGKYCDSDRFNHNKNDIHTNRQTEKYLFNEEDNFHEF